MDVDYSGKTEHDVIIEKDTTVTGMIVGNVTVQNGATFTLQGMVVGNVAVMSNSTFNLPGTVVGKVVNNGGQIQKTGMIIPEIN